MSTKAQLLYSARHSTAMRYAAERRNLDESIEELRQIADGRNDIGLAPLHPHNVGKLRRYAFVNKRAVSDLRSGVLNTRSNLLPSTCSRAKGVSEGYVLSMAVHLLSGFRVAFQELTDRHVELREQLVNVVFRSHLDHLSFC